MVFAAACSLFGCAGDSPLFAASVPGAEADWTRTVEAAKKEGKVSVFLYKLFKEIIISK